MKIVRHARQRAVSLLLATALSCALSYAQAGTLVINSNAADTAVKNAFDTAVAGFKAANPDVDIKVNTILVEIETAKAAVELPSPWEGKVTELLVQPGQTVDVGAPIIVIDVDPNGTAAPAAPSTPDSGAVPNLVGYGPKGGAGKRRRPRADARG